MSIPNKRDRKVHPTHPCVMLREDFLPEYGLTVSGFANAIEVSRQTVNELLRERRAVSPEMALRLSRLFSFAEYPAACCGELHLATVRSSG